MIDSKVWNTIMCLNFLVAICIYLPIFIPLNLYLEAKNVILTMAMVNLLVLICIDKLREQKNEEKYSDGDKDRGKVIKAFVDN